MSYHDTLRYLARKTLVIELYDQLGGRVAVCPEWNGRIMTSTFNGLEGESFGCVNVQALESGEPIDFGGEDQWTISPLFYAFECEIPCENVAFLRRTIQMSDAEGEMVELELTRKISLLDRIGLTDSFGSKVADFCAQEDVLATGFCTENTVQSLDRALIAGRLRGMFNASPQAVLVLPVPSDDYALRTTPMTIDYLGGSPHGRIRHLPQTLLIRADGQGQCQVTIPFFASAPYCGAIELRSGTLTLWTFDLPNGENDSVRLYNSGHPHLDALNESPYYEVNCFSSALKLLPGDSHTYYQSILHLNADNEVLDCIIQQVFDVALEDVSLKILR